jgi:hypothetical protein
MRILKKKTFVAFVATAAAVTALGVGSGQAQAAEPIRKPKVALAKADPTFLAKEQAASKGVVSTTASRSALATVQARVSEFVARNGTKYTFGIYSDPATGDVVVHTDAPSDVLEPLISAEGDKYLASVRVQVLEEKTTDIYQRRDDIPSYWGGAGISASGAICSSGYAVKTSAGTKYFVTAGHCYANGTSVKTESGLHTFGTVSNRALASLGSGPIDMELLGGQSYAGRVYTGGVTSSTSAPVVAAGTAYVGYTNYCHSGRTTGEQCGHTANSITAMVCTQTGCKAPVIAYTGGVVQQPGDSGGAFYAKDSSGGAWIRGHVIAGDGVTGYVEPWTQVVARYGVSIVTG